MEYYNNKEEVKTLLNRVDDKTRIRINKILYNRFNSKEFREDGKSLLDYITVHEVNIMKNKLK